MDRERLDNWCERAILGLVLAILVYSPLAMGAVRPRDFVVVEWLILGVMLIWLGRFWINPKHRLFWPPVCWAVVLFMSYAVGRYLTSDIEFVARQEMIRVLVYGFLFLAVLHNLHRQELTSILGITLLVVGMLIALYAVVQFLTESNRVWHFVRPDQYRQRGSGTFISPNNLAAYLGLLLPLGLAYTLTGRFNHLKKILLGYASLVIFSGIVVSVSRGGWAATGIALVVLFCWLVSQREYRLQSVVVLAALIAIAAVFTYRAQLSQNRREKLAQSAQTTDLRFRVWQAAWSMWKEHCWWGVGPAHFDDRFRQYRPTGANSDQMQTRPERVHNDYLNTLADWGLIGALLVAAAWGLFYWEVFLSWPYVQRAQNDFTIKRSNKSSFVVGGALGLLAVLLHSFVDFNMHIPAIALLAVTIMALVSGFFRFATEAHWHTLQWPLRLAVTVVLAAGSIFLGVQSWRRTVECHWLGRAEKEKAFSSEQIAAWERAFAAEDHNSETAYNIGEGFRLRSWQGAEDFRDLSKTAMEWFKRGMVLNPYDPYSFIRYGMCLDWLGRHDEAAAYFKQAAEIDPNGYYTAAHVGWHYAQADEWVMAKEWLEKSLSLYWVYNPVARYYLQMANQKLATPSQ